MNVQQTQPKTQPDPKRDAQLADEHYDIGVEDTFPASDPPAHGEIVGPPHETPAPPKKPS
ncbi:MAG TPA: hypothetical protein VMI52_14470 [Acetobacteraceae bacterium]|nr:hypothetical protein [Acetobacteraceae bacterium]